MLSATVSRLSGSQIIARAWVLQSCQTSCSLRDAYNSDNALAAESLLCSTSLTQLSKTDTSVVVMMLWEFSLSLRAQGFCTKSNFNWVTSVTSSYEQWGSLSKYGLVLIQSSALSSITLVSLLFSLHCSWKD